MEALLARAQQGVDPDAPGAFLHIFMNIMAMVPWVEMFWWNLAFVAIGALIGWWRGRLFEGVVWSLVLGPFGWFAVLARPRPKKPGAPPPPLPR